MADLLTVEDVAEVSEEWRTVPGLPDVYQVSDHGRVRSFAATGRGADRRTVEPRVLRGAVTNGYQRVLLRRAGTRQFSVHSLVARAFIGPRPTGHHVRHLDGVSTNNRASNLAYGLPAENEQDKRDHARMRAGSGDLEAAAALAGVAFRAMRKAMREGDDVRTLAEAREAVRLLSSLVETLIDRQ